MKLRYAIALALLLAGCLGVSDAEVVEKVSFDKNCPEKQVQITSKITGAGRGSYKVAACGQSYDYEHAGTVIYEKGKGPAGTN